MKKFLRRIILYANLAFAIVLIISYSSRYISPAKFWPPAFLGLAYPFILAINFLFMGFWLLRRKKEFLISFLAILFGWHTLTAYISLHPGSLLKKRQFENLDRTQRSDNQQIKLMSFNVRMFDRNDWAEDPGTFKAILQTIQEEDADIVCIQEFLSLDSGPLMESETFQNLKNTPNRHLEYSLKTELGGRGNATFSSYPIVHSGSIRFQNTINISIFSDIKVGDDTIRVYNNHLQSIHFNSANYRFLDSLRIRYDNQQLDEIRDISVRLRDAFVIRAEQADTIAAHIAGCPYRVIVCGDFNDTPVSYAYYRLSKGMTDAFTRTGWGTGRTYIGKFPSFRIDYIFFSQGFEALLFTHKKVRLSDHFPIITHLRIQ